MSRFLDSRRVATLLMLQVLAATLSAGDAAGDAFWVRDPASPGDWFDPSNWNPVPPHPVGSVTIDNGGTAVISGGQTEVLGGWIGLLNSGILHMTGGEAVFRWGMSMGSLRDAHGALSVSGGTLRIDGALNVSAGAGRGDVVQSGGEISVGALHLGNYGSDFAYDILVRQPEDYGRGYYRMIGGELKSEGGSIIGNSGVGEFRQEGGRVEAGNVLHIGGTIAEFPNFPFVPVPVLFDDIALAADACEPQAARAIHLSDSALITDIWFPPTVPSRGLYELTGGTLAAGTMFVDRTGRYLQRASSSEFDFVAIQSGGTFRLSGGELHAELGFLSASPLNLHGEKVTLSVGAGILNLSSGVVGGRNAHIAAARDSLTILPAGFNANIGFGTFNHQGMVHVAGRTLFVRAGKRIAGAGVIEDPVVARGEIDASGLGITLNKGLRLQPGAQVDLGAGELAAVGRPTAFRGGELTTARLVVGGTPPAPWQRLQGNAPYLPDNYQLESPGLVRHIGGRVDVTERLTVLSGVYRLSSGELDSNLMDIGVNRYELGGGDPLHAAFVQTGGVVSTAQLSLSQSYLHFLSLDYGHGQNGVTSATLDSASDFVPLLPRALDARYRLAGGELIADAVYLGQSYGGGGGTTRFIQTGGAVRSNRQISMYGPQTTYIIDGGELTARRLEVGAQFVLDDPNYFVPDSATLAIRNAAAKIEIRGELLMGGGSRFQAVPGSTIRMTNPEPNLNDWQTLPSSRFRNLSFEPDDLAGLQNLTLLFDGMTSGVASTLEVAGRDLGFMAAGFQRNFALDALHVGGENPASLRLVDLIDNQRNGAGNEALYVDTLIVTAGSTLDLGGLKLYYRHAQVAGDVIAAEGALLAAPEPKAAALMAAAAPLAMLVCRRRGAWSFKTRGLAPHG
jgi:hypothetical protein